MTHENPIPRPADELPENLFFDDYFDRDDFDDADDLRFWYCGRCGQQNSVIDATCQHCEEE